MATAYRKTASDMALERRGHEFAQSVQDVLDDAGVLPGDSLQETATRLGLTIKYSYDAPSEAVPCTILISPGLSIRQGKYRLASELAKNLIDRFAEAHRHFATSERLLSAVRSVLLMPSSDFSLLTRAYDGDSATLAKVFGVRPRDIAVRSSLWRSALAL